MHVACPIHRPLSRDFRWHDNLSCHGRVRGPRDHGSVYVLCLVRYLRSLANSIPLTVWSAHLYHNLSILLVHPVLLPQMAA